MQRKTSDGVLSRGIWPTWERVIFELGRDMDLGLIKRCLARGVSGYERAPLRILLGSEAAGPIDDLLVRAVAWIVIRLAGIKRVEWRSSPMPPPASSGWQGNLLFLVLWGSAIVIAGTLLRRYAYG